VRNCVRDAAEGPAAADGDAEAERQIGQIAMERCRREITKRRRGGWRL